MSQDSDCLPDLLESTKPMGTVGLADVVDPSGLSPERAREARVLACLGDQLWELGLELDSSTLRAEGLALVRRALWLTRRTAA
jgi:hypothetical protein